MNGPNFSSLWQVCLGQAWAACCAGSLPIGAVICDGEGRVVAQGRNRLFEKTAEAPYLAGRLAHAEINAIRAFEFTGLTYQDCRVYTTLEPCPMCLGAIRLGRFQAVHYAAQDVFAGSSALLKATDFMQLHAPHMIGPSDGGLERLLLALLTETVLRLQLPRALESLPVREKLTPQAVKLGWEWHQSGIVAGLIRDGVGAHEMTAVLAGY